MVSIFIQPLSTGPVYSVWALMRFTTTMPSAAAAMASMRTGMPSTVSPMRTVSMDERMGQPTASSVTPSDCRTESWPSAVAPPWLPMQGTRKGSAPRRFSSATTVARMMGMPVMPRLPAVTATRMPGRTFAATPSRAISPRMAAGTSAMRGVSMSCSTRAMSGKTMSMGMSMAASDAECVIA